MLISLRVKTLDSQDHEFSVEDDVTVRQFKERIQEKTGIEADLQRLIYCGRVMSDDYPLRGYDINGKVIHLVQRPPPGSAPRAVSSSSESTNNTGRRNNEGGRNTSFLRSLDGMVLGAMAIPMNTNSGTTQSITHSMNPSSTLCMNRITVARHMLNCANNIAAYLENPERGLNNTEMDILAQQTMESTVFEVGISAVSDADVPQQHVQGIVQAFQGVVSAAFRQNGLSNIQVDADNGTAQATIPLVFGSSGAPTGEMSSSGSTPLVTFIPNTSTASVVINGSANEPSSEPSAPTVISASVPLQAHLSAPTENNEASGENASSERPNQQITRTQTLAEVIHQMRTVQTRLEPFLQQYYDILQNEPTFSDSTQRESAQRVFDRVSEALHYLSHAQHAISDLMLDLSLDTPRHLCCRPILVEQSAFVSSGFAVPNMLIPIARRTGANGNSNDASTAANNNNNNNNNNSNNDSNNNNNNNNNNISNNQNSTDGASNINTTAEGTSAQSSSTQNRMPGNINPAAAQRAASVFHQLQVARLIQAVVNSVPPNADVHVEINQNPRNFEPHIEIQHMHQQPASTSANTSSNGSSPEQENSQPRVTTATHPTTSTQTRSTARPQVHATGLPTGQIRNLRPVPIPSMQLSAFDRYLPCNSHHIREPEGNQQRPQQFQVQRNPQIHIQRPAPNTARIVLNNRRSNNATQPSASSASTAANSSQTRDMLTQLNEVELNTNIPIFGCNQVQVQVRDLINVSPTPSTLNRMRNDLRQYFVSTLSLATPLTDENVESAVNQVIILMNQFLLLLPDLNIPDYDTRASIENLIRKSLPPVINLIKEDESSEFGTRLLREIVIFSKRLIVILLRCIGRPSAQDYLKIIIEAIFTSIASTKSYEQQAKSALQWLRRHMHTEILRRFQDIRPDTEDVIEYLVIRRPAPVSTSQVQTEAPMETDADDTDNNDGVLSDTNEEREAAIEDIEPLPAITIGAENWHHNFPTPWLPIITRDISRQRRQSPQRPFSDAYISGMSSKRRKLINGSKPSLVEPNNIITQGVRQVLQASRLNRVVGSGSSASSSAGTVANTAAAIEDAIASNPHIHEPYGSYEQAILNHVQNRISTDPDYAPERFPNCSKWINKNK